MLSPHETINGDLGTLAHTCNARLQKLWQKDLEFEVGLAYKILSLRSPPSQKLLEKTGMLNPTDELHNANVQENITR